VNRQSEEPDPGQMMPRQAHNRPLQAITSLILACAAAVSVNLYGVPLSSKAQGAPQDPTMPVGPGHLITLGGSVAFVVFGLISTFAWARWARTLFTHLIGPSYGSILRFILIVLGVCVVIVITLSVLGFHVGQLVLGGTVTAVLVTIAAQQALSNLFAGMLLQIARPFKVGDSIWMRSGALGGTIEGVVTEISITYVTLDTDDGRVLLPNSQVIAAAVSQVHSPPSQGVLTAHRYGRFGRSVTPRPPMATDETSETQAQDGDLRHAAQRAGRRRLADPPASTSP
jgi:small-conductance mechanosensitive channel